MVIRRKNIDHRMMSNTMCLLMDMVLRLSFEYYLSGATDWNAFPMSTSNDRIALDVLSVSL